ncbi:glycoside hydrolase family 43 protein [uncultured Cellulomonas sp.]|uniref:glycoside hydrolase family 43 protein n=1 Tax=uncultured Cellulomonas sp. TaxID=189682 RepID=UPI00263312B9|nr:glycoside hydrolase family 43 protein [uncultured Cellulomonas sp.]
MTSADTFANPVIPGFHPDPSICRVGDTFYLVTSSFEYFPGIPIFTSTDLVSWTQIGHVLTRVSQVDLSGAPDSGGIFAPTIRHHDGTFYVTSTNVSGRGHFIVQATDPAGPWSDPVWVDQNGIDPSLYFADDEVYFTSNVEPDPSGPHLAEPDFERGIQQSVVDPATGEVLVAPRFIWGGTGARYPEGPHLFRRGGYYYLLTAEGGTEYGHRVGVGRSTSPWGPFSASPYGPVVSHAGMTSAFQAMGHADFVELADDEWWMVCLGVRPVGQWPRHLLGRETFLARVRWTDDGWPRVGERGEVAAVQQRPGLPATGAEPPPVRDDFGADRLAPCWQFVRRPLEPAVLHARRGLLALPTESRLDGPSPTFVGRRQQHHAFTAGARLRLEAAAEGDEAGIAVRMNGDHHYALGLRRAGAVNEIVLRIRLGRLDLVRTLGTTHGLAEVDVTVRGSVDSYVFSMVDDAGHEVAAPPVDAKFLSAEVAGGFTGVMVGMYAAGAGGGRGWFDWFDYTPLSSGGSVPRDDDERVIEPDRAVLTSP